MSVSPEFSPLAFLPPGERPTDRSVVNLPTSLLTDLYGPKISLNLINGRTYTDEVLTRMYAVVLSAHTNIINPGAPRQGTFFYALISELPWNMFDHIPQRHGSYTPVLHITLKQLHPTLNHTEDENRWWSRIEHQLRDHITIELRKAVGESSITEYLTPDETYEKFLRRLWVFFCAHADSETVTTYEQERPWLNHPETTSP